MEVNAIEFTRASIRDAEAHAAYCGRRTALLLTAATLTDERIGRASQHAASAYSFAESAEEMRAELAEMIAEQSA